MTAILITRIEDILKRFNKEVNKKLKKKGSNIFFYAFITDDGWIIVGKEPDGRRIAQSIYDNLKCFSDEITTIQTIAKIYVDALT